MQALLKKLKDSDIKIDLVDKKLDIQAPKGAMTEDLLNEIKLHKNDLIEFINLYKTKNEKYLLIPKVKLNSNYALSSSQRRLWLLSQFEGGNTAYNMPSVFELKGSLIISSLEKAFSSLISRHESLRTIFKEDEAGEVRQIILNSEDSKFQLQYEDLYEKENSAVLLKTIIQKEIEFSFYLANDSLLRAKVIKTAPDTYIFICVMHHIISDGHSADVMTNELFALYDGYIEGDIDSLPALELQYRDYAAWQQDQLKSNNIKNHKSYWLQQFEGELPVLDLPAYQARPAIKTYNGKVANTIYNTSILKDFSDLCKSEGSTLFMGLLATVKVLLYRYTNQNDIIIGSPIAGREHADLQNQIGIYVNTLALRTQFDSEDSFKELLANVKKVTFDAYEHQIYPFDELVEQLPLHRDRSRNPLFDVMVTLQNLDSLKANIQRLGAITIEEYKEEESTISKFDLGFTFGESDKGLELTLTYNTDIYSKEFAERILNHLETLLHSIVMKPNVSISSLNYLTEIEKHQLLKELNSTKVDYPKDKTIIDLFEEQVDKTPEKTAILFEGVKLNYTDLNAKANQLAHHLKSQGVQAGSNVVLCFDRHLEMAIVGMLGILKSGAAYVPIDPDYPQNRINYIIENSGAKFIVTNSIDAPLLQKSSVRTILLDKEVFDYNPQTIKNIEKNNTNRDSAYVIYTSGTTGTPKGVLVNHQNIMDYLFGLSAEIKIEENQSFSLMSTISTDLGNTVVFSSLISGGVIHLFSKDSLRDINYIQQYFINNEIDCIKIVPSYWKSLEIKGKLRSPGRMIIFGGEELSNEIVSEINLENPDLRIINHYGPTETTIGKLLHEVNPNYNYNRIPIGKAFSNTQLYVVDRNLSLCAIGIIGELLIGGEGVSNGYLNNLKLSEEKFIENVFQNDGRKLYRTGDLVVMHSDGNIEFKGRIDNQVKILGHRIELTEIENALNKFEGIKSSIANVIETDKGTKRIAAYIVYNKEELAHNEILDHLRLLLPSIMIPSILIKIDEIPFTSNGKINYKALPGITAEDGIRKEYVAPNTGSQIKLVAIWQEVLGVQKIGITDNFFELGGHSLIVAQVINTVYKELGKSISFRDFFANPTVEGLSKKLKETDYSSIPKAEEAISYPLTSTQKRLWILSQLEGGSVAYNMPVALRIKGVINYHLFQKSFENLIQRHEILRTYFKINEQREIRQHVVNFEDISFVIDQVDFINKSNTEKELENYLQSLNEEAFDLEQFPLIRASLIKITDEEHIFFFSRHHIISDGWSSQIIISEVVKTYNALFQGKEISLPELHIQFKDYAVWFNEELQQEKHQASEQYWLQQFSGELPVLDLPSFKIRPLVQTYNGDSFTHTFSKAFLEKLKTFSKEHDVTLFMSLMAGINSLLHRYTGQDDIIIGIPIAGREHPNLENQLGLYLNTLAIRTQFKEKDSFLDLIAVQKGTLLGAYEHQSYPFDGLVEKLNLKRDTSRSPLFDVMVVLQNQGQLNNVNNAGELNGLQVEDYDFRRKTSQFDINFIFSETEGLALSIEYNTDIYDAYLIERMFVHFENLMNHAINNSKDSILSIDYISEQEKKELLEGFNNTTIDYPKEKTIVDLFDDQVIKTPDNIAVVFEEQKLTYTELNKQANQLAQYLRKEYTIQPDDLIGIKLDRSEQLLVAIFGILKSGAAYVPIDINYPEERINYIQEDTNCKAIIDQKELEHFFTVKDQYSIDNLQKITNTNHLAYVIYTSGTTGKPKGVMVEHGNVIRLVKPCLFFPLNEENTLLSTGSVSFDATIIEYFGTLLNGAKLILTIQDNLLQLDKLDKIIKDYQVNSLWMTAPWFSQVADYKPEIFKDIKQLIVGGDIVSPTHVLKVFEKYPTIKIVNGYGPTENTTFSTTFDIKNQEYKKLPIGGPISNSEVYILDEVLKPVPIGVSGKLYVSGAGVARGYLNHPDLTNEKFLPNPFLRSERMYDTGDLGRWLPDGNIEFLGRKDTQVKIRGFRIELKEIENILIEYSDDITEVIVEAKNINETKVVVAYYVSEKELDKSDIRSFLQKKLPEYMIPSFYVALDSLPLTSNGKIDLNALPNITGEDIVRKEYIEARTETEQKLVEIWQEILGIEKIGITDNFFELGGQSLKLMMLENRIELIFNKKIDFYNLYKNASFSDQIKLINSTQSKEEIVNDIKNEEEKLVLAFHGQERLYALSYGNAYYYIKRAWKCNLKLDLKLAEQVFNVLIERHETLRSNFVKIDNRIFLKIASEKKIIPEYFDLRNLDVAEKEIAQFKILNGNEDVFNLENDLLIRLKLIHLSDDEFVIFIILDHILIDGWGLDLLLHDLYSIYNSLDNQGALIKPLPEIEYTYRQVLANKRNTNKLTFEEDKLFWMNKYSDGGSKNILPYDFDKEEMTYFSDSISLRLDEEKVLKMVNFSKENNIAMLMLYLSCVNLCLAKISGQSDITTGIVCAERGDKMSNDSVGFMLNTLPVRTKMDLKNNFSDNFEIAKSEYLNVVRHRHYPFIELVKYYGKEFSLKDLPYYKVFVYASEEINVLKKFEDSNFIPVYFNNSFKYSIYELIFVINQPENSVINISLIYNKSLFKRETIEYLMTNLLEVIDSIEI